MLCSPADPSFPIVASGLAMAGPGSMLENIGPKMTSCERQLSYTASCGGQVSVLVVKVFKRLDQFLDRILMALLILASLVPGAL